MSQFSLQPDWQMDNGFFNSPVLACTQILVHMWGPRTRILQTDLTQSLVPSVAQANIYQGVGLVLHKQRQNLN